MEAKLIKSRRCVLLSRTCIHTARAGRESTTTMCWCGGAGNLRDNQPHSLFYTDERAVDVCSCWASTGGRFAPQLLCVCVYCIIYNLIDLYAQNHQQENRLSITIQNSSIIKLLKNFFFLQYLFANKIIYLIYIYNNLFVKNLTRHIMYQRQLRVDNLYNV